MKRGAVRCSVLGVLASVVSLGCASTQLEIDTDHPASHAAGSAALPRVGAALDPKFEAVSAESEPSEPAEKAAVSWTCPMHPEVVKPEPGNCPICGMKLVPLEPKGSHGAEH